MAKSKSGGTRTYIRGRVGSDVYSIGRDAKGKKQQVVRSLAESVANPQTQAQMKGRMIMSTIAQAIAVLRPIIDHSFDGLSGARANLSAFTSQNYALIKADVEANPNSDNKFGLNKYQEKGAKQGAYVISDGQATIPAALVLTKATGTIVITLDADAITVAGLKDKLGMTSEEYFTLVGITANGEANYERFRVNPSLDDSTAISGSNIGDVFAVEGNAVASISIASNVITIQLTSVAGCSAVIVSKKIAGGYIHNKAVLGDTVGFEFNAGVALPTYPVGAQNYLNGGDIFGQSESFNTGGDVPPTPSPTQSSISGVTVNGASLAQTGQANLAAGSNAIVIGINAGTDGASYGVACILKSAATIGGSVASGSQTSVAGASVNLTEAAVTDGADKAIVLCRNNSIIQVWGTLKEPVTPEPSGDATLTALTVGGTSVLNADQTKYDVDSDEMVYAGNNLNGCSIVGSSNHNLQVGDSYTPSIADYPNVALTQDAGSESGIDALDSPGSRLYLIKNNQVVQVCGIIVAMDS